MSGNITIVLDPKKAGGPDGKPMWYDTGVDLLPGGAPVKLTASGTIKIGTRPGEADWGPDGKPSTKASPGTAGREYIAPGLTRFSLVGRIGPSGAPFQVTGWNGTSPERGRLYLAVNDLNTHDNSGSWTVEIEGHASRTVTVESVTATEASNKYGLARFVPTGVMVSAGAQLTITATGKATHQAPGSTWTQNAPVPEYGPDGMAHTTAPNDGYFLAPGLPVGALVGRIGGGAPFLVGASFDQMASASGGLELAFNDSTTSDNKGSFTAVIELK